MGKKLGIVAVCALALALCFALVGCGVDKSKYTGEWQLAYGSDENLDADSIALMDSLGLKVVLTLNEDGTGSLDMFGEKLSVSWEAKGNTEGTFTVTDNGTETSADLSLSESGDELTITDSTGASMTFKRPA